ncbi:MAG: hypothetical protein J6S13_05615 [Clostridia bacterium]|nr:hypothetical protein [Clostridia bacterium]
MSYAKDYVKNKKAGIYENRGAIDFFPLEVFIKDDTNVTIYDNRGEIVCTVKGSTLRDRIFDPINGRLNRVIVTDGV